MTATAPKLAQLWLPRLIALSDRLRDAARGALLDAIAADDAASLRRQAGVGAGDVTFGIDVPAERALDAWLAETARELPLSLLTEETGWRHMGPGPRSSAVELAGFDHGGPHIVVDPIDGTRNLMTDLRSAWSVIALAAPSATAPRMSDVVVGVVSEIPDSRAAQYRRLSAVRGERCRFELAELNEGSKRPERPGHFGHSGHIELAHAARIRERELDNGTDVIVDHAYFPFFRYMADLRPEIAAIEARFFARIAEHERADVRNCYDDQYISNGGQLALLALGSYRMIADLRAHLAERRGRPTLTSKPYDIAGAVVCARAAGCVITAADGSEIDFPIDTETPLSFVGWVNAATRDRLAPHLDVAMNAGGDASSRRER